MQTRSQFSPPRPLFPFHPSLHKPTGDSGIVMDPLLSSPFDASVFAPDGLLIPGGLSLDLDELLKDDTLLLATFLGGSEDLATPPSGPSPLPVSQQQSQPCSSSNSHAGAVVSRTTSGSAGCSAMLLPSAHEGSPTQEGKDVDMQRSQGPSTRRSGARGPVRLVTTAQQAQQQAAVNALVPSPFFAAAAAASAGTLLDSKPTTEPSAVVPPSVDEDMSDSDSEASNDTEEGASTKKPANKRKAPEIDWRAITDPSERRRQRRLAKNRMTAARSRERKKVQWADMEVKLANIESDNKRLKSMLQQLAQENTMLRSQLEGMGIQAVSPAVCQGTGHSHSIEPAALVIISILLLLCCALPGVRAILLGSAVPLLLLPALLNSQPSPQPPTAALSPRSSVSALLRFLVSLKPQCIQSAVRLRSSLYNTLCRRPYSMRLSGLPATVKAAASSLLSALQDASLCTLGQLPGLATRGTGIMVVSVPQLIKPQLSHEPRVFLL